MARHVDVVTATLGQQDFLRRWVAGDAGVYGGTREIDWQYRFLQRTHWGRRWHGPLAGPRWTEIHRIAAGIKGPPDKPLRISPVTLGAILR